ncbi:granzyme G [Halichoeres trimaculatus]|uniref:granzyme G n=1 Tax=Halichoeres trimaculatus TaxID=147232 RepID=UPI003D9E59FC
MTINCELVILILALTPYGQVHTEKIIGGRNVAPHHRPYMVYLKNQLAEEEIPYCGGFILSEDFVMTAAHCQAQSLSVFLGSHKIGENDVGIPVEKAFPHENFSEVDYSNDLMLLKLSSKVTFGTNVGPIQLASVEDNNDDGSLPSPCSVSGWGIKSWHGEHTSRILMEANVTLIENELCPEEISYCSGGKTGPAQGDSGGPLVCKDEKAFGVVAAGKETEPGHIISKYAKISAYRSWINTVMNITGKP